jgi:tRNA G37 N-methylase TrmD
MSEKILIIDAMNAFIRNYVMNPSLSADGSPIGGTKGFLMSLQKMANVKQLQKNIKKAASL